MKHIRIKVDGSSEKSIRYVRFIMSIDGIRVDNVIIKDLDINKEQEIVGLIAGLKNNNRSMKIDYVQDQKTDSFVNNQIELDWYSVMNIPDDND